MRSARPRRGPIMDLRRITIGDYIVLVASLLTVISLFMTWFVSNVPGTHNQWAFTYSEVAAVVAPGGAMKGLEIGIEIATRAEKITGTPTSFSVGATGAYGQVAWHTGFESITELQRAQNAIGLDPGFMQYLDENIKGVYQPGATQTIYRRLM